MKQKRLSMLLFLVLLSVSLYGQKSKKEVIPYRSIQFANIEEAFPVAAMLFEGDLSATAGKLNWGEKEMISTYYEYRKILGSYRLRLRVFIDNENTLNVEPIKIQTTNATNEWVDYSYVEKREKAIAAEFIEHLRLVLQMPEEIKRAQDVFYTDLVINALFFNSATELAGNRWFDSYVKDKNIKWKVSFIDLSKNTSTDYKFSYVENYSMSIEFVSGNETKFYIKKYTNSDQNVMKKKGSSVIVEGKCVALNYDNSFNIILTD